MHRLCTRQLGFCTEVSAEILRLIGDELTTKQLVWRSMLAGRDQLVNPIRSGTRLRRTAEDDSAEGGGWWVIACGARGGSPDVFAVATIDLHATFFSDRVGCLS